MSEAIVVYVTCPREAADKLAEILVEAGVTACVSIVPALRSVYRWQGEVRREDEALLISKTRRDQFEALSEVVLAQHPYSVPEILALPVTAGHAPYLAWIVAESGPTP